MTTEYRFDQIAIVSTEKKKPTDADKDNYIGLEHLSPDTFDVVSYGADVAPKGEKLVMRKGDVLFGKRRAYQKKVGIAPCDGIFSAHGMVLRPNEKVVDARFFPFFIKSDAFLDEAIRISVGSLSPTVNWRDLRELRFNLPPMERQRKLAGLLWAGENLRSTYRRLLDACDEQVKSRFVEMFGGGSWPESSIGDLAADIRYGTSKKAADEGEYTYLRMNNMTDDGRLDLTETKRITLADDELENCLVHRGDVLFNRTNSREKVGKTAVFDFDEPMVIAGYIIRVRLKPSLRSRYLSVFMNLASTKKLLRDMAKGAVHQANINAKEMAAIELPVPPIELQDEFLSFVTQVDKSEYLGLTKSQAPNVNDHCSPVYLRLVLIEVSFITSIND